MSKSILVTEDQAAKLEDMGLFVRLEYHFYPDGDPDDAAPPAPRKRRRRRQADPRSMAHQPLQLIHCEPSQTPPRYLARLLPHLQEKLPEGRYTRAEIAASIRSITTVGDKTANDYTRELIKLGICTPVLSS